MSDKTYKNIFSEGYTTYNSKGTTYDPYGSFDINGSNATHRVQSEAGSIIGKEIYRKRTSHG